MPSFARIRNVGPAVKCRMGGGSGVFLLPQLLLPTSVSICVSFSGKLESTVIVSWRRQTQKIKKMVSEKFWSLFANNTTYKLSSEITLFLEDMFKKALKVF